MATPTLAIRKKIVEQALQEIEFARKHKQGRIQFWKKNEDMYYGKKPAVDLDTQRANVMLPKMQGFVDTLLSKVDSAPNIKYVRGEEADLKKERRINALKNADSAPTTGNWAFKDLLGKKQGILYGRAIYEYHADSLRGVGYRSHLTNVDCYDFLIDPAGGGLDMENAMYMGRTGVYKTKLQLEKGVDDDTYLKAETKKLLSNGGVAPAVPMDEEERNKENRYFALKIEGRQIMHDGMFKFWEWYTTYEGVRYYILLNEASGTAIRLVELTDLFDSNLWPFWSWATNPDIAEFWTPSPCDGVRELFMAQSVIINQHLDNNEAINKPMKAYDMDAVVNPSMLKYRRDGTIPLKRGTNINNALVIIKPDALQNNERIYALLENIGQVESGVTAAAKGVATEDTVRIYQGNLANVADRLGLLNKSYANGYQRFALLYWYGVQENLTQKIAVRMIGIDGVEFEEITRGDILPDKREFDIVVETSDAEQQLDLLNKKNKITFLSAWKDSPLVNQKTLFEVEADINEISQEDVRRLLAPDYGDAELMAEAARDIQRILNGEKVEPNQKATNAYREKLVDYLRDKGENLDPETLNALIAYIDSLKDIVVTNAVHAANSFIAKAGLGVADAAAASSAKPGAEGFSALAPVTPITPKI